MKKTLFPFLVLLFSSVLSAQTLEEVTTPVGYPYGIVYSSGTYSSTTGNTVGLWGTGVARTHTGWSDDDYFTMPNDPVGSPESVEIVKVFVRCNLSSLSGGSLQVYAGTNRYTDEGQAWNSPSSMTLIATKTGTGLNETEVTGSAFTTLAGWLDDRGTNQKKIYFTLKESDESKYATISEFALHVQYRYKYKVTVNMDRGYDGNIGTITGAYTPTAQINGYSVNFIAYRNESVTISLNPTAAIGSQQYAYKNMVVNGSGYSQFATSQRIFTFSLTDLTSVNVAYNVGVQVTLDNQVHFLNGNNQQISGSTLKASQAGQDIATVTAGNSVIVPQNVSVDYTTLYGNSGENLNYQSTKIKHQNWNADLSIAKLVYTKSSPSNATYTAWYHELRPATVTLTLEGVAKTNQTVQFKDPWRVVNNTQPGNWDSYTAGSSLGIGNDGNTVAGVFQSVNYIDDAHAHYRMKADQTKTIDGTSAAFVNWSASNATASSPNAAETPVTFTATNATVTANYHGVHLTNTSSALTNTSQRKIVHTEQGYLFLVYESLNRVWLERSDDGGSTWALCNNNQPIDNGEAKQPAIDYLTAVTFPYGEIGDDEIYVTYQQKTSNGNYTIQLARFDDDGQKLTDTTIYTSPSSYSNNATPVVSVNWFQRSSWEKQVVGIWKEPASSGVSAGLYWYGAYYIGSTFTWNGIGHYYQLTGSNGSSLNPTLDVYKYDVYARQYGPLYYYFAWEQNGQWIKYGKISCGYSGLGDSGILSSLSYIFSGNYRPSIIAYTNTDVRVAWNSYLDSPQETPPQAMLTNPNSPSTYWNYSSYVTSTNIDKFYDDLYDEVGFAVCWTRNSGSGYSSYAVKSTNLNSSQNLNTSGKDLQLYNGDSYRFAGMRGIGLSTSSPYAFQFSGNVENGQMGKSTTEQIASGRTGVVTVEDSVRGNAHFFFTIGDVMVDGQQAAFPEIADTIKITSAQQLTGYLTSKPFTLNNTSKFTYNVEYGVTDSAVAVSAVGANNLVRFKVDLLDASTGETIGTFDDVKYDATHIMKRKALSYDVNTGGIGTREVQVRLSMNTDLPAEYSLGSLIVPSSSALAKDNAEKTQIGYQGSLVVTDYALSQNYPNPFNPSTVINYQVPVNNHVLIKVYDILGRDVRTLVNEEKSAGRYSVEFDASNLSSGIYFYTIHSGNYTATKKMMLMK